MWLHTLTLSRAIPFLSFRKHTSFLSFFFSTAAQSRLAVELACALRDGALGAGGEWGGRTAGEVVNADAMQMYRGLEVTTNQARASISFHFVFGFHSNSSFSRVGGGREMRVSCG